MHFQHSRAKIRVFEQNTDIIKGTQSRFSACSFIKMLFFCRDKLYLLFKEYDHVIMSSKNQYAHSPGSHLIKLCENSCKLMNHGIKPFGQQYIQRWQCWHNPLMFFAILVLLHPTSGHSEILFYFEIHSEIAEIHVSGIINRKN